MSCRTQITLRCGRHFLAVAVLLVLAGFPTPCASQAKQTPQTAKERLLVAAALSLELVALAERPEKILRRSHLTRYSAARPWASLWGGGSCDSFVSNWPTETDAPALRALLSEDDPRVRGLALEALATLRLPEDAPRIASLLADESPAAPYVDSSGRSVTSVVTNSSEQANFDPLAELYSWYPSTVGKYARRALGKVTGLYLDEKTFDKWWAVNKNYKECLWYWNQRIRTNILMVKRGVRDELRPATEVSPVELYRLQNLADALTEKRLEELPKRIADEVMLLEPETAAKILLLATDCGNGGEHSYFERLPRLPLKASRLLELLDGEGLWPDVDWNGEGHYNRLVYQIMLASPPVFDQGHIAQLQAILLKHQMGWNGYGAMVVGISRLLPFAQEDFNSATRQGYLRAAIEGHGDLFARNMPAAELVRIDLPNQWQYLKKLLFLQKRVGDYPDLVQTIIRALGECPITAAKREALIDLIQDERIKPLLKQEDERYRYYLGWTIREHLSLEASAPQEEFSTRSGNPMDAVPGILSRLKARAKSGPPIEKCRP